MGNYYLFRRQVHSNSDFFSGIKKPLLVLSTIWKILLNTDRRWPSFFNKLLICAFQLHFASIVTPRYLHDFTRSTCILFICKSTSSRNNESMVLLPTSMSLVFSTFMASFFFSLCQSHIQLKSRINYLGLTRTVLLHCPISAFYMESRNIRLWNCNVLWMRVQDLYIARTSSVI